MSQHIDAVAKQSGLDALNSKITYFTNSFYYVQTAENTYEYMNKSVVVPEGHIYLLSMYAGWNSGRPTGLGVGTSSQAPNYCAYSNPGEESTPLMPTTILTSGTWYLFGRRASVPTVANLHNIYVVDIVL